MVDALNPVMPLENGAAPGLSRLGRRVLFARSFLTHLCQDSHIFDGQNAVPIQDDHEFAGHLAYALAKNASSTASKDSSIRSFLHFVLMPDTLHHQ
jgi:hypothetical protein